MLNAILIGLGLILSVLLSAHLWLTYRKAGRYLSKIPGPYPLPLIGNVLCYFVDNPRKLQPLIDKYNKLYFPIFRLFWGHWSVINILHPDDAEVILSSSKLIRKGIVYEILKPWMGDGLLISTGNKWHNRRKLLTPAFHFNVLQKYFDILNEHGERLAASLETEKKEMTVNLNPFMTYHTLSAICESAMGTPLHDIDNEEVKKFKRAMHDMGEIIIYRMLRPWYLYNFIFKYFSLKYFHQKRTVKVLHDFSKKIIQERTEYHQQTNGKYLREFITKSNDSKCEDDVNITKGKKRRLAFLDLLIAAYWDNLIDYQGIVEEVDTFIFEGHDTSNAALVFLIQILAEHTDIQEKVRTEVNEMFDSCGGALNFESLNKLPYLERCIKEGLRLYPSVHFMSRQMTEDVKLKNYLIPDDAVVNIFVYEIHRCPEFWENPNDFDPDRFLPEKIINRHPFSYIPFSGGLRNCIGQKFAMMEMKIFIAYIIRNFRLEALTSLKNIDRLPDLILRSAEDIHVKFVSIKN